jgi:hypothetical protein
MFALGKGVRVWAVLPFLMPILVLAASNAYAGGGNYLIITAEDYSGSAPLNQFINFKTAQGFRVSTYVAVSGTDRADIKSYIESLWEGQFAPDYILIVGDAPSSGSTATSARIPNWIGGGSRQAVTDLPYACMDAGDDWYPDIFIGRFCVQSVDDLQAVVDKSLTVESGVFSDPEYVMRAAFLATDDPTAQAEQTHDWVIDTYMDPNDYVSTRIYGASGGGTSDVADAVNAGSLFTVYFGHSGSTGWWTPSFDQADVQSLTNEGLYGLVFGFSCNTAHFSYDECFGETWQREADKGAAVYLSASDYVWWGTVEAWDSSRRMEKYFFKSFFVDDIWEVSPAWQAACYRILSDPDYGPSHDHTRNIFEEFVVLGDPSLLLPQANGFTLDPTPTSHDLCCPPASEAQYTIEVGQLGGFDEVVTLSASGEPSGATVNFSENSLAPPFTSVLTIGNLDGAAAASYNIVITGTSATMERSTNVALNIANDVPAAVTLLDPPDGASGVDLSPELTWQDQPDASEYFLQIATDSDFTTVVYSQTVTGTSHTVDTPLDTLTVYFWRVQAENACGQGPFSDYFTFMTVNRIMPVTYDMLNGESGSYTYYDDTYDGDGDNDQPLAPLTNGLGDLTDGVIATEHWNSTPVPYVGWVSIDPTITFHFAEPVSIEAVTLHLDDSGGGGGVHPPTDVTITVNETTLVFPCSDPPGDEPFAFNCSDLGLFGDLLELTIADYSTSGYMMLSEVEFFGAPQTGACCIDADCSIDTEAQCFAYGGVYQGDDTTCDPNPCGGAQEPGCLIISEVVKGVLSGGCPRFIEITNTGANDYTFAEGGVIVQMDEDTDVFVDVDLTGYTIASGQAFVINSNESGACTGAFGSIYGFPADLDVLTRFGDGNDRYILTNTADGSNLLDIYGVFGESSGEWEYYDGYSYRLPAYNQGNGGVFDPDEWFFGGNGSLDTPTPEKDLLLLTDPTTHTYDEVCSIEIPGDFNDDGEVTLADHAVFCNCLNGPGVSTPPGGCTADEFGRCDMEGDSDVDLFDFDLFQMVYTP